VSVLHGLPLISTRSIGPNSATGREASRISDPDLPASVPQMVETKPTGFARGARSRTVCRAQVQLSPPPWSTGWALAPSAYPNTSPPSAGSPSTGSPSTWPRVLGPRVLGHAGPRATNCAGWQGEGWGLRDPLNQTMCCKDRRGKPPGPKGLIERRALVQSPRGRSVNRVRSDEGVAWPVQGPIGLGTGAGMSQAGTAGCGCFFAGHVTRWNSLFPKENPECRYEENDRNR
jgi:hypothetical protein